MEDPKPKKPRLIVIAGPNGVGKTSITEQLLRHTWMDGCEYINPDVIAHDQFGDWDSPEAVQKAASYAENIRETCLREKRDLAFETVLSMPDKLDFIERARSLSDLGIVGCKLTAAAHFSPAS